MHISFVSCYFLIFVLLAKNSFKKLYLTPEYGVFEVLVSFDNFFLQELKSLTPDLCVFYKFISCIVTRLLFFGLNQCI